MDVGRSSIFIPPILSTPADRPPRGERWVHEIKFDGFRTRIRVSGGRAQFLTRNGHDWSIRVPSLLRSLAGLPDCELDGEACILDPTTGLPDFGALEHAMKTRKTGSVVFLAFDALAIEGEDLRPLPYSERKRRLRAFVEERDGPAMDRLAVVDDYPDGDELLADARRLGLEGIVSKDTTAPYVSGRTTSQRKIKIRPSEELVIGGVVLAGDAACCLLLGRPRGAGLAYVGRVSSGISHADGLALARELKPLLQASTPFAGPQPGRGGVLWVRPELVVEVAVAEPLADRKLRQASYKRIRRDIAAADLIETREQLEAV